MDLRFFDFLVRSFPLRVGRIFRYWLAIDQVLASVYGVRTEIFLDNDFPV